VVRRVIQAASPEFAVQAVKTMDRLVAESEWQRRVWGTVLAAFAVAALLLAAVGLYGVMSHLVAARTREIGIQLAIGARPSRVLREVLAGGLGLCLTGALIGSVTAALSRSILVSVLWNVAALDPLTYGAVLTLVVGVAAGACLAPAWRAARVDPLIALRQE